MRLVLSFVLMVMLGTCALLLAGCRGSPEEARRERHDRIVRYANQAADEMVYVRDDRTGLCFAFWWIRYDRSGTPAMASVPCDAVRDRLAPSN